MAQGNNIRGGKMRRSAILSAAFLLACLCLAFPSVSGSPIPQITEPTPDSPLKQFWGFYQFPNRVAFIEIRQKDQDLIAKQVWDNREYVLVRKDDLRFESKDEEYQLEFTKDASGNVVAVKILNRVILTKVDFDPNIEPVLSAGKLKRLEGRYRLQSNSDLLLEIKAKGNGLELTQLWDGKIISFVPRSELEFYNKALSFPLMFVVKEGSVTQAICFTSDVWDKAN